MSACLFVVLLELNIMTNVAGKSFWAQHFDDKSSVEADNLTSVLVESFGHTLKGADKEKPHIVQVSVKLMHLF